MNACKDSSATSFGSFVVGSHREVIGGPFVKNTTLHHTLLTGRAKFLGRCGLRFVRGPVYGPDFTDNVQLHLFPEWSTPFQSSALEMHSPIATHHRRQTVPSIPLTLDQRLLLPLSGAYTLSIVH